MYPPAHVCRALYDVYPWLRLAWNGKAESFAVVQLYHVSDCGDMDDPITFREYWDITTELNEHGDAVRVPASKGPIFSKEGDTKRDWDPLTRIPIDVVTLADHGFGIQEVFSGSFLPMIREWLKPIEDRIYEAALDRGKQLATEVEDTIEGMTDFLWHEASKPDAVSTIEAKKHIKPTRHQKEDRAGKLDLTQRFVEEIPKPPKKTKRTVSYGLRDD